MNGIEKDSRILGMLLDDLERAIKILGKDHPITLENVSKALIVYSAIIHNEELKRKLNQADHGKTWSRNPLDKSKEEDE